MDMLLPHILFPQIGSKKTDSRKIFFQLNKE
jgi:hypothetical protein